VDADVFAAPPRNLREGFLDKYSNEELVQRIQQGKPLQLALDAAALKRRIGDVDALTRHLRRLPSIDWQLTREGWLLYSDRCETCHGPYGTPPKYLPTGVRRPPDLSTPAVQAGISDAQWVDAVRHGRAGMPALTPRIPEDAGPPLVAFVKLLSPGFETYSRYCAKCHGDDGLGERNPVTGPEVPVKFDQAYFQRVDSEDLANAVWHMVQDQKPSMPHYRWTMRHGEAGAIVEYLKQTDSTGVPQAGDDDRKPSR
jgi:mono/diheme cytochrome c family protein